MRASRVNPHYAPGKQLYQGVLDYCECAAELVAAQQDTLPRANIENKSHGIVQVYNSQYHFINISKMRCQQAHF